MVLAGLFAYFQVWLPLLTLTLHQCVQKRAMTPPSGPMDAQTDPQSSPTKPKRGPNKPQHEHHEPPRPWCPSRGLENHGSPWFIYVVVFDCSCSRTCCPNVSRNGPSQPQVHHGMPKPTQTMPRTSPNISLPACKNHLHFDSRNYRHPSNQT
jgi:hypothetical protein